MQNSFRGKDRVQLHMTADKREIKDFPKLPSATSFIRKRYTKGWQIRGGKAYDDQTRINIRKHIVYNSKN